MGRTREFDPDAALQDALELFWERGYEATSMNDLVDRLGIGRASIYATFGNKHDLYLRALERYGEGLGPALLTELSQPGPALPAIRAMVRRYALEAASEQRTRGCFIANAAAEVAAHDPEVARRVEASWGQLETLLHSALLRAAAQGELPEGREPRALARMLVVLLQGVRVVGKVCPDGGRVRDAADEALSLLE